jgi:hypothetical protein
VLSENPFIRAWYVAKSICSKVEEMHPDLVVALAHSGWPAVYAATVLWSETRAQPFPPLLRTNLGREKIIRYDTHLAETRGEDEIDWFVPDYIFDQIPEFLDWLAKQNDWLTELRQQVQETLETSIAPKRILVFDDFVHEGATKRLALGLFNQLYPDAWIQLFIADWKWRDPAIEAWLKLYHPDLIPSLQATSEIVDGQTIFKPRAYLNMLAVGTTDVVRDSLAYRHITAESEVLVPLLPFLPAEEWLNLPKWFYAQTREYILQCHSGMITPPNLEQEESSFLRYESGIGREKQVS